MKKIILITIILLLLSSCSDNNLSKKTEKIIKNDIIIDENNLEKKDVYISASEFKKEIEKGDGILIDLRKPEIIENGVIEGGAININFDSPNFKEILNKLDKEKKYLIYCQIGGKSQETIGIMDELGFKNVIALSDGYSSWFFSGYNTVDFNNKKGKK